MRILGGLMLVVALALTGCATTPQPDAKSTTEAVEKEAKTEASVTPAPIPVSTVKPETESELHPIYGNYTQDEFFLASLKDTWMGAEPTAEQQLAAGLLVCQKLAEGTPKDQVRVMEGSGAVIDNDNANIVRYAIQVYCPERDG